MRLFSKLIFPLFAVAALAVAGPAVAQQKLKWAHVYETSEPYHTESVWAAAEIKKRTNGKFDIEVFPASTLGKETDINQGLTLGTVDMIISGPSFAARSYPRLGIAYYPFIFRDADHLLAYSKSPVFADMVEEFRKKTGIQILAYTYYGARQTTAQKPFTDCAGMKGRRWALWGGTSRADRCRHSSKRRDWSPRSRALVTHTWTTGPAWHGRATAPTS